ncbi:hypothetical protein MKU92_004625 [Salmonella enterica]|nr:hypothetical protein [Salmonella enterica subsp. enterica]EDF8720500.1 hypothetical protein [Salmonella enterica]EDS4738589.1 hypothetical protein [Salmonella enterica subsp. enterica serovar Oranienburg]EDU6362801.1 hypothetical protein [Salmonella enterica subsp. enterica serovar Florian]EDU8878125.1 hypothetical protein [Salmonella enterica subsp. enterica]
MWVFLKYNNIFCFSLFFLYANHSFGNNHETNAKQDYYSLNDNHTTDVKNGLWEIREKAVEFLRAEKIKHGVSREALEPNLKIWVPRCSVPLRVIWTPEDIGFPEYTVSVICDKTIKGSSEGKWSVEVPTIATS